MNIDSFLIAHGTALVFPLSVIEGPVVSIAAGFLSARNYLEWYWALGLLVCGDLTGDMIYYLIGQSGLLSLAGPWRRFGLGGPVSPALRHDLMCNATKMLLVGKWTHSIGWAVLIGAGMLRVPLRRFLLINLLATIPKSSALFGLGFFFGENYPLLEGHILLGTAILCTVGLAITVLVLRRTRGTFTGLNRR